MEAKPDTVREPHGRPNPAQNEGPHCQKGPGDINNPLLYRWLQNLKAPFRTPRDPKTPRGEHCSGNSQTARSPLLAYKQPGPTPQCLWRQCRSWMAMAMTGNNEFELCCIGDGGFAETESGMIVAMPPNRQIVSLYCC
uniref:Uncharacterized protein n=1 Tax=Physcomitrium patens TaxID=3218 RepID=A0A7I3ZYB2_PHYPA